ncbi:MAG: hypothetical protein WC307_06730, partial [Candidatus Nanoarchaeia archaeon]
MAQPLVFIRDEDGRYLCHSVYVKSFADSGSNNYSAYPSGAVSVTGRGGAYGRGVSFKRNRSDYIDLGNGANLN